MLTRTIPSSGEKLPVIGLGTWRAFDVDLSADIRRQLEDVLSLFVKLGGRVIDSSPMYGRAEEVIGDLTSAPGIREKLFLATKVWTQGQAERNSVNGTFHVAFAHEPNRPDAGA